MTYSAKERLQYYALKWADDVVGFDRLCVGAILLVLVGFQAITTGAVVNSHVESAEAVEAMATVFQGLSFLVLAYIGRLDSILAIVATEVAYHAGYADFDRVGREERLTAVWRTG